MTHTDSQASDSVESDGQATIDAVDEPGETAGAGERGAASVPQETRTEVLARDGHRCQVCGRRGPAEGGLATLHVHHIERDPDGGIDVDAPANLTTLCRSCHSWVHQQATRDDAPVTLTDEDLTELLPQDIEILRYIAEHGPAGTSEIADALTMDLSVTAVRERLAVLMGLDNRVETRDRQLIDQDANTGEWGLPEQIEHSARGRIPDDVQLLWQRIEDELVRQALARGCDRQAVMDVLDLSRRSTFYKEKRGRAYDFPLDALDGRGGRPQATQESDDRGDAMRADDGAEVAADQQQLHAVAETDGQSERVESSSDSVEDYRPGTASAATDGAGVTDNKQKQARENLQQAIDALAGVEAALRGD